MADAPLRLALVTNIPAPYRVPVFDRVAATPGIALRVLYGALREPDRDWDLPPLQHEHVLLPGRVVTRGGRHIHVNPAVWRELQRFAPQVVLTTGYNPTHLAAFVYARTHGAAHVAMTDGTPASEAGLGAAHRWLRRQLLARSAAAVAASAGGVQLLRQHGMDDAAIHRSPLCANPALRWAPRPGAVRDIELLFSGRLVPDKNPGFALQVAQATAQRLGRPLRMAVLGGGPLLPELRRQAATLAPLVQVDVTGPLKQADLPGWFQRSKLFLFPTRQDPWGVVANEACEAGVPVLVSPQAGVAGELVRDGDTGRVLPLDLATWVDACAALLGDEGRRQRLAAAARAAVAAYGVEQAAAGIVGAARQALLRCAVAR
jgi:glycosyltransferase involved in cell wall biosynthesis